MPRKSKSTSANAVRVAIYVRFSTDGQGDQIYTSTQAQQEALFAHAEEKGYKVSGVYSDEAFSGRTLNRPQFRKLLTAAAAKEFDAVLVTYMDRLGRGDSFTVAKHELAQLGVDVLTAFQDFGDGVAGYISESARKMMDGVYPELIKEWTAAKMRQMLQHGYHCGGAPLFGYDAVPISEVPAGFRIAPKRMIPNANASLVVRAWEMYYREGDSQADVMRYLTQETGVVWTHQRVQYMLNTPTYRVVASWGRFVNEEAHEAIISEDLWQARVDFLEETKTHVKKRVGNMESSELMALGVVWCQCGARMSSSWSIGRDKKTKHYYYLCNRAKTATCRNRISATRLHTILAHDLIEAAQSDWKMRSLMAQGREALMANREQEKWSEKLRRDRDKIQREIDRYIVALRVSPVGALPTITRQIGEAEARLSVANKAVRECEAAILSDLPKPEECHRALMEFGAVWSEADDKERIDIIRGTFARVTISHPNEDWVKVDFRVPRGVVRDLTDDKGRLTKIPLTSSSSNLPTYPLSLPRQTRKRSR
jgi:DNA invertase Pin-like site-specific DNA recombinase